MGGRAERRRPVRSSTDWRVLLGHVRPCPHPTCLPTSSRRSLASTIQPFLGVHAGVVRFAPCRAEVGGAFSRAAYGLPAMSCGPCCSARSPRSMYSGRISKGRHGGYRAPHGRKETKENTGREGQGLQCPASGFLSPTEDRTRYYDDQRLYIFTFYVA